MNVCVQICSKQEWKAFKNILSIEANELIVFPYGEYAERRINNVNCIFFNSGPTVTKASGAAQYAIDNWQPSTLIVLGTCGGIGADLVVLDVVIANKTVYYNCFGNDVYLNNLVYEPLTIEIDNSWINWKDLPSFVHEGTIATNDHYENFKATELIKKQNILCVEMESAAIAYVCSVNKIKCCIARGITDFPLKICDESLINKEYRENTPKTMKTLLETILPQLLNDVVFFRESKGHSDI
jgi:adenosylhomocysteine nucleosidase